MTSLNVIENKISHIQRYLDLLKKYQSRPKRELEKDVTLKGAVERYLYLAIQATLDLAEAVIAFKKFPKPAFYSACFEVLKEKKLIGDPLAEKLIRMTGFRNVLAHDYARLDFGIVYDVLQNNLEDIKTFVIEIESKVVR